MSSGDGEQQREGEGEPEANFPLSVEPPEG